MTEQASSPAGAGPLRAKGVRLATAGASVDPIEPTNRTTRMKWLYAMITAHDKKDGFSFSAPSTTWLKHRIVTHDMSTRRDRYQSTWWEDTNSTTALPLMPTLASPLAARSSGALSASDVTKLSLEDVMGASHLLSDFKESLEDGYGAHNIEFLESVQAWHTDLSELKEKKDEESLLYDGAASIYAQFLNRDTAGDNLININEDVKRAVVARLAQVFKKGKAKADYTLLTRDVFAEAVVAVRQYVSEALWPEFVLTDDYTQLCIANAEAIAASASKQAQARKAELAGEAPAKGGGYDFAHSVAKVDYPKLLPRPFPPWINKRGWQSVTLTISAARGPVTQGKHANQLYLLASSGSRVYKGGASAAAWEETYVLPVSQFSQYVAVAVCQGSKCLGFVPLSLAELDAQPNSGPPRWVSLRTEDKPGPCWGPGLSRPAATTPSAGAGTGADFEPSPLASPVAGGSSSSAAAAAAAGGAGAGTSAGAGADGKDGAAEDGGHVYTAADFESELQLSWVLSEEEAPAQADRYRAIYADETATGGLGDFIRGKVSKKKKRFTDDNFNLDLTYITPNVIAMGFPSEGAEGVYRNPLKQVQQFFMTRHPNAYKIYNLCSERDYDHGKFEDRVAHIPFDDHNPPAFPLIKQFCEDARAFLSQHPQNVISVHCKAGKGRTGTMIASYFVYAGLGTAPDCLLMFGRQRTSNAKGVTIPSQIRYVGYFDNYCTLRRAHKPAPGQTTLFLQRVYIRNAGKAHAGADVFFTLWLPGADRDEDSVALGENTKGHTFTSRKLASPPAFDKTTDSFCWDLSKKLIDLSEDFRMEFATKTSFGKEKLFQCWLNTRFIRTDTSSGEPRLIVRKSELDKACKDTKHKKYTADMHLELVFSNLATATTIKEHELTAQDGDADAAAAAGGADGAAPEDAAAGASSATAAAAAAAPEGAGAD